MNSSKFGPGCYPDVVLNPGPFAVNARLKASRCDLCDGDKGPVIGYVENMRIDDKGQLIGDIIVWRREPQKQVDVCLDGLFLGRGRIEGKSP